MKTIPRSFFLFTVVAIVSAVFAHPAHAGRYELIKGKGVEVCEAYKKNLDSFSELPYSMACERKLNPEMKDFKKPEWKEMDVWENRELIRKIAKFLEPSASTIDDDNWMNDLKRSIANHHTMISVSSTDINNDGKADYVVKYVDGACQMANLYSVAILVLDKENKNIDIDKTKPLLQNNSLDRERYPAGGWHYSMYDIFLYKNEAYFDKWSDSQDETGFLHVFESRKNIGREICAYRYRTTN